VEVVAKEDLLARVDHVVLVVNEVIVDQRVKEENQVKMAETVRKENQDGMDAMVSIHYN
jgi:hypothetical protein